MKTEHSNPLFDFYKNLYFHEIEIREKLNARVQTPLIIIISIIGALAFMLQNYDKNMHNESSLLFIVFLAASFLTLLLSVYYFIRSWYNWTYSFLPTAKDTESYRGKLYETYKEYKDGEKMAENYLDEYLCNYFIECSSNNTQVNDKRTLYFHKTNRWLIMTAFLALISFFSFCYGNLDTRNQKRTLKVEIMNPINLNKNNKDCYKKKAEDNNASSKEMITKHRIEAVQKEKKNDK